jgi:RES domain-containing protein
MIVFRISKNPYAHDLSGRGAEKAGGRWNSRGIPVLYTSQSRALATLELVVHMSFGYLPKDFKLTSIELSEDYGLREIAEKDLPEDWKQYPFSTVTQKIGNEWIRQVDALILKVPSVVVQEEFNYLVNPLHPDFKYVKIKEVKAFEFDLRLFS